MPSKKSKKKKKAAAALAAAESESRRVVGPDYVQHLHGTLFGRDVALLLCGEAHEDAVDVTRPGGQFMPKEGWVKTESVDLVAEMYGRAFGADGGGPSDDDDEDEVAEIRHRVLKRQTKPMAMGKAREWATELVKDDLLERVDMGEEIALVWCPVTPGDAKGRTYLVSLCLMDDDEDSDEDSDEEERGKAPKKAKRGSSGGGNNSQSKSSSVVPEVESLVASMNGALASFRSASKLADAVKAFSAASSSSESAATLFEWTDLDPEARALSHRRLIGEDVPTDEYDALVRKRKVQRRKAENIWTWDDWFTDFRSKCSTAGVSQSESGDGGGEEGEEKKPALHMILEASIPPWEVELHRAENDDDDGNMKPTEAAECLRCLSEDSVCSEIDIHDPASDGIGSFIDFMYRRFMDEQLQKEEGDDGGDGSSIGIGTKEQWLHCVDSRDLGCEHACVAEALHERWLGLLKPEERAALLLGGEAPGDNGNGDDGAVHAHWKGGRCFPEFSSNPEDARLERLKSEGALKKGDAGDGDDDNDDRPSHASDNFPVTFPSFELFFGQNTDILYYDPHVKVAYGPFLARCVRSADNWAKFFSSLFFGGTVAEALSVLDLRPPSRPYLHIRSPILKDWNAETGEYEWSERNDDEMDVTSPFLPAGCHLKAAGSSPPRTWSSQIYSDLVEKGGGDGGGAAAAAPGGSYAEVARSARDWALSEIKRHAADPKGSDDKEHGGEWFLAYLRAAHRDVYDDIDRSDPGELLTKKYMTGECDGRPRKHKIGDITVPDCGVGFQKLADGLGGGDGETGNGIDSTPTTLEEFTRREKTVKGSVEVMAKILIDIWMSKLVDFSAALKIAQVVADAEEGGKVVVVCYMGGAHTRAMAEFYCDRLGFKKKAFVGSLNWDEDRARTLQFPPAYWDPAKLF